MGTGIELFVDHGWGNEHVLACVTPSRHACYKGVDAWPVGRSEYVVAYCQKNDFGWSPYSPRTKFRTFPTSRSLARGRGRSATRNSSHAVDVDDTDDGRRRSRPNAASSRHRQEQEGVVVHQMNTIAANDDASESPEKPAKRGKLEKNQMHGGRRHQHHCADDVESPEKPAEQASSKTTMEMHHIKRASASRTSRRPPPSSPTPVRVLRSRTVVRVSYR